jgi:hypothetical protein
MLFSSSSFYFCNILYEFTHVILSLLLLFDIRKQGTNVKDNVKFKNSITPLRLVQFFFLDAVRLEHKLAMKTENARDK